MVPAYKWTIADAVDFSIKHLEATKKSVTVQALVDEFLTFPDVKTSRRSTKEISVTDIPVFVRPSVHVWSILSILRRVLRSRVWVRVWVWTGLRLRILSRQTDILELVGF